MKIFYTIILLVINTYVYTQENVPFINASYIGDVFTCFSGGIKTGSAYLGKMHLGVNKNIWHNSEFSIQIENTHGANPSKDFIGDIQVASNINNGNYTYLYELWYKYSFKKMFVKLGVIDLNSDYFVSKYGGVFLNSSFGIQPSASMNMPVPIFPMNALGVNFQYIFNNNFLVRAGIWDGNPGSLDRNPYNVQWKLSNNEGMLSVAELEINHNKNSKQGTIKLGMLYHSASFSKINDSTNSHVGNIQFHLLIDQVIVNNVNNLPKLGVFSQIGYLPNNTINVIPFSFTGGVRYSGVFFKKVNDILSLAVSYAKISSVLLTDNKYKTNETTFELVYSLPISKNITIKPDLQYIFNTGARMDLTNCFVGFIRVVIEN